MESEIFGSRFIGPRLILDSENFYLFLDLVWKVKYLAAVLLDLDFFWILKIFIFV